MKKMWVVLRIVTLCVCLLFFVSSVRKMRVAGPKISKIQIEVNQAWNNLEHAAPLLAKEYTRAVRAQQEGVVAYSFHNTRAYLLGFPLALLLTSLLWQFVITPILTKQRLKQAQQLTNC